ncbi:MAG: TRZ/ATZ family hydrolase [Gammaproteobacteria bacterium]|nr:TRZ/ATZ family hydrolase [Gammaproteobacteria bacterium]MCF6230295.1 TRZ/ATZ family hydrolase [Gammaproteobacteria bacterium]
MQHVDTIIDAGWIIPVEPTNTVLEKHSLVINNGHIIDLLPSQNSASRYTSKQHEHLTDHALIPGLINTHTHGAMSLLRGLADDLPLMSWLQDHIWPAEAKFVDQAFVYTGTQLAMAEMLRCGTTCFNDMYFFPDQAARAANAAGMRATIGMILIDFPTAWAQNSSECLEKGLALHDEYRNHPLINTALAPHAPYTVSDESLQRALVYAEELNIPLHMHLHETADEISGEMEKTAQRPLARLHKLGLLSPRLLAVHMTQLNDDEIALIAKTGVSVVHCPESNLKLASGFSPIGKLLDAGINLALGTDGAASNNDLDMLSEMRTAAQLAKSVSGDASTLPAYKALEMATLGGARALGIDDKVGTLTIGKAADITAIDLGQLESQPVYHPISQIVYTASRHQVTDVWVAGKQLLKARQLTTLNSHELINQAQQWRDRIKPSCSHA